MSLKSSLARLTGQRGGAFAEELGEGRRNTFGGVPVVVGDRELVVQLELGVFG